MHAQLYTQLLRRGLFQWRSNLQNAVAIDYVTRKELLRERERYMFNYVVNTRVISGSSESVRPNAHISYYRLFDYDTAIY